MSTVLQERPAATQNKPPVKPPHRNWVKTPTVYQMEATECGAASLAMILGYYGCFIPLEQLRIDAGVTRDGCNARNILRAARKYGLSCKGYSYDLEKMLTLKTPCILHWNFNHFVVFEGIKGGCPYINDPAVGRRRLTMQDLDDCFTGIVLTFEKTPQLQTSRQKSSTGSFIRRRLRHEAPALGALLCAGLLLVAPGLIVPTLSQIFVDDILMGSSSDWLGPLLVGLILTTLYSLFFSWMRARILLDLQGKLSMLTSYRFLHHLLRLPVPFFEQRYAGDLVARVGSNDRINQFLTGSLAETVLNLMLSVFYLVLMLLYDPMLTLVGVSGVALALGAHFLCSRTLTTLSTKSQQDSGKLVGAFYAGLALTSTLKASGAENEYLSRLLGYYARTSSTEQHIGSRSQILSVIPEAISKLTNIIVLMVGGILVIRGDLTAGMLTAFQSLLSSFISPVSSLLSFFQQTQTLKADMNRVEDIEKYQVSPQFQPNDHLVDKEEKLSGFVELRNVSFGYSPMKPPLITDFNFKLEPGRTVALVGSSGCGKSTVSKLVSGLNAPWEGEVLLDGIPLQNLPAATLNSSVATVNQSITLFSGTIRENLTLWNHLAMEEDVLRAAKDACIHDVITSLPGAYDYRLTEGGTNLSGGQRQRLEIARALVMNPSILIMDEATSALDPMVEKQVLDNIRRRGCTCVMVAHRLSTIRDCDEIIVMKDGHIVERGTHEQLRDADGLYASLIRNA